MQKGKMKQRNMFQMKIKTKTLQKRDKWNGDKQKSP